jgi:hypothetical protein
MSRYASTLLPSVCVASAASHGSFVLIGPLASVIRFGWMNGA